MARLLSTAFVVLLLAGTAGAFALTQGAKLERSPIFATHVSPVFSPDCGCEKNAASIDFRLRKSDRLTVWIEHGGDRVATVVPGRRYPAGKVELSFDGITGTGIDLPDGTYIPVVRLAKSHKTIRLPSPIRLDSKAPTIRVAKTRHAIISPDGDRRRDTFRTPYALDEPARALLFVEARGHLRRVFRTLRKPLRGTLVWNGSFGGRVAAPGLYVLRASAVDSAGNAAKPSPFAIVQVRYVSLGRKRIVARPGGRFAVRVSTDSPTVTWRLNGRTGTGRRGTLRLRAPRKGGVYHLYVSANGHAAKAAVVVT